MARPKTRRPSKLTDFQLINVDFSYDERKLINDWLESRKIDATEALLRFCDSEFKVSTSYDHSRGCYTFTLTSKHALATTAKNPTFLFRHNDFDKLLGVVYYYWSEVLANGTNLTVEENDELNW